MAYWLFKSEPETFSLDDLCKKPNQTAHWDGVRNYQARNMLRDQIKVNDKAFFYYSNCKQPGIVGIIKIVKSGYPDFTAWDANSKYYDPACSSINPRWYMVDVSFIKKLPRVISLQELKDNPFLKQMQVARKGNRLSITPVTKDEWEAVLAMV